MTERQKITVILFAISYLLLGFIFVLSDAFKITQLVELFFVLGIPSAAFYLVFGSPTITKPVPKVKVIRREVFVIPYTPSGSLPNRILQRIIMYFFRIMNVEFEEKQQPSHSARQKRYLN